MDNLLSDPLFLAYGAQSGFLISLIVNALALLIAAHFLDGVEVESFGGALIVALVLALLNATIGTVLTSLTGFYRGILGFVIDALVILLASSLMKRFRVKSFSWAFLLAIVLTILNALIHGIIF